MQQDLSVRPARRAFELSIPVMLGYVPMGMAFGLLFVDLGYPWYWSTIFALVIFAGAAQFLAIGLLAAGAGLAEVAVATLLINARHLFYGLSLSGGLQGGRLARLYQIFGLTDETYSILTGIDARERHEPRLALLLTAFNHLWWTTGCTLGALLGGRLQFNTLGLEFVLTALFLVLTIEQYRKVRRLEPFAIALGAAAIALLLSRDSMLVIAMGLSLTALLIRGRRRGWSI